ncbi:Tat pathway signal protein [Mobiluncus mulieris]|uniref:Tat pathway signal protein n=1 Tax=Mobiluncus mulieris TaxID=2052 RepID=A0A7Y0Y4Q9_9ACTO|nr:C39 family peptidase [Mobiluncus mulieris]NMW65641.1 Tat pathway signal protein [Mobiluncus mulieris]
MMKIQTEPSRLVVSNFSKRRSAVLAASLTVVALVSSTQVSPALAGPTSPPAPQLSITERISGADRYETMFKASSRLGKGAAELFLVSGKSQVDGITCGTAPGPVLYVDHFGGKITAASIRSQIDTLAPKKLTLLGGQSVLTDAEFAQISAGYEAKRVAGANRIETAIEFSHYQYPGLEDSAQPGDKASADGKAAAPNTTSTTDTSEQKEAGTKPDDNTAAGQKETNQAPTPKARSTARPATPPQSVYLVNQGTGAGVSPDAAPASTLFGGPILVSAPEGLSEATLAEINRLSPKEVVLIGGTAALSTNIETQLKSLQTPPQVSRWGGKNRQETAMIVAAGRAYHGGQNSHIYLARADRPVDAVTAGVLPDGFFLYLPPNMPLTSGFTTPMAKQFNVWSVIPIGGIEGKGFVFLDESLLPPPPPPTPPKQPAPSDSSRHVEIPVPYISQIWPYHAYVGCEPTALLMGLQSKGYASGVNLRSFLAAMPRAATNPARGFVGSPYQPSERLRTTIYPAPLADYGRRFGDVRNMAGASMDQVIDTIRHGNPVVVYLTLYYRPAYYRWFNIDGRRQRLLRNNHAVLLTGYDANTQQFLVADPWNQGGQNPFIYWKRRAVIEPLYNLRRHAVGVF